MTESGHEVNLPRYLGVQIHDLEYGFARGRLEIQPRHMAPNGYLHAASVIALSDTACGFGCMRSLPEGARSFTTIELKSNFIGTATDGTVSCEARLIHGGRTTQLWDATVTRDSDAKTIALFRCTQLILYR